MAIVKAGMQVRNANPPIGIDRGIGDHFLVTLQQPEFFLGGAGTPQGGLRFDFLGPRQPFFTGFLFGGLLLGRFPLFFLNCSGHIQGIGFNHLEIDRLATGR